MWFVILFVVFIVICAVGSIISANDRKKSIEQKMASSQGFNFTQKVEQDEHHFVFGIDSTNKKVLFLTPERMRIVDYSQICAVEMESNGVTVASRSLSSLVGASIVGGVIGAMAVNQKIQEKAHKIVVKVSLRTPNDPFVKLVCLDEIDDVVINEWPYERRVNAGKKVVDLLKLVIDEVEQSRTNTPDERMGKQGVNIASVADEITKLANLKEKGLLTEEEFSQQKYKLLNQNGIQIEETNSSITEEDPIERKVNELIESGQKLKAVKYYMEATGCDLKTAYNYVEKK